MAASSRGVAVDTPELTVLDTRDLEWEQSPLAPYMLWKVLSRDETDDPVVLMRWLSPEMPPPRTESRGAYYLARELWFCLAGQFSHLELDGYDYRPATFESGDWMDRDAGSVDAMPKPPPVGVRSLAWLVASGDPFVGVCESRGLPAPASSPAPQAAVKIDRPSPGGKRVVHTPALPWEEHPVIAGARHKVLSRRADGDPTVTIVYLPPGTVSAAGALLPFRELAYVLEGDLDIGVATLREGFWLDRCDGMSTPASSRTGCMLFHVRIRPGAELVKETEKYARWTRTLTPGAHRPEVPVSSDAERAAFIATNPAPR